MVTFYEAGFWVLVSVLMTGAGAYFLWARDMHRELDTKMTKDECNSLGIARAELVQKDISYLKVGQERLENQMTNMQKTLNAILRALNGGVREKI